MSRPSNAPLWDDAGLQLLHLGIFWAGRGGRGAVPWGCAQPRAQPPAAFQSPAAGPSTSTTAWSWTPAGSPACRPWSSPRCPVSRGGKGGGNPPCFPTSRASHPAGIVPASPSCAGPGHVAAVVLLVGGGRAGGCAANVLLAEKKKSKKSKGDQGAAVAPSTCLAADVPALCPACCGHFC